MYLLRYLLMYLLRYLLMYQLLRMLFILTILLIVNTFFNNNKLYIIYMLSQISPSPSTPESYLPNT